MHKNCKILTMAQHSTVCILILVSVYSGMHLVSDSQMSHTLNLIDFQLVNSDYTSLFMLQPIKMTNIVLIFKTVAQ